MRLTARYTGENSIVCLNVGVHDPSAVIAWSYRTTSAVPAVPGTLASRHSLTNQSFDRLHAGRLIRLHHGRHSLQHLGPWARPYQQGRRSRRHC
jgi:hypothetical protein